MTFSLELSDDVIEVRDWVHQFASEVIRPAAAEWDEREETPWPVIQEAAKVGLYSPDFFAQQAAEPTGLGFLTAFEEMFWATPESRCPSWAPGWRQRRWRATELPSSWAGGFPKCSGRPVTPNWGVLLIGARRRF